jgi:organic hydroperoxide reductase OsmC/OhrA
MTGGMPERTARPRSYTYQTGLEWKGERRGLLSSEGKPSLMVSSPPEFKGEPGVWTPEDLFVAAVEVCHMSTFLAFARKKAITVLAYASSARGTLEFIDGDYRFTRIVIAPVITVPAGMEEADVHGLLREAHRHCLVSNSVNAVVEINAVVRREPSQT